MYASVIKSESINDAINNSPSYAVLLGIQMGRGNPKKEENFSFVYAARRRSIFLERIVSKISKFPRYDSILFLSFFFLSFDPR